MQILYMKSSLGPPARPFIALHSSVKTVKVKLSDLLVHLKRKVEITCCCMFSIEYSVDYASYLS